jgi:hypothetical protein
MGYGHDHDVYLDKNGDGTSSWAYQTDPFGVYDHEADGMTAVGDTEQPPEGQNGDHVHEVMGGVVRNAGKAGMSAHTHYLEPAHAAKEQAEASAAKPADKKDDEESEPLTLGVLYCLPAHHPDYYKPDSAESLDEVEEKALTSKDRNKLPDSSFCGPDRSFPANDKSHVQNGLARLTGSKLSSSQKASVKACLTRKGKAMGMKFSDEAAAFAAKLVDAEHRIELNLYPLPLDGEALTAVLSQVYEVPHTPAEREAIIGRIAAHSRSFLETGEWTTQFGDLTSCEEGAPIEIAITTENYALLYSAMAVASREKVTEETAAGDEKEETETSEKATDPETETPAVAAEAETPPAEKVVAPPTPAQIDEAAVEAAVKSTEAKVAKDLSGLDFEKQIERLKEAVAEATEQAATETQRASHALAHSCAMLMKLLRKASARGKTLEALVKELSVRSTESLSDKLTDLCGEYDEGGPAVANLPRLDDPTIPEADGEDEGRAATATEQEALPDEKPEKFSGARLSPLEELELEAGDPAIILHSPTLSNLFGITGDVPSS